MMAITVSVLSTIQAIDQTPAPTRAAVMPAIAPIDAPGDVGLADGAEPQTPLQHGPGGDREALEQQARAQHDEEGCESRCVEEGCDLA